MTTEEISGRYTADAPCPPYRYSFGWDLLLKADGTCNGLIRHASMAGAVEAFQSDGKWSIDAEGLSFEWQAVKTSRSSDVGQSVGKNTSSEGQLADVSPFVRARWEPDSKAISWRGVLLRTAAQWAEINVAAGMAAAEKVAAENAAIVEEAAKGAADAAAHRSAVLASSKPGPAGTGPAAAAEQVFKSVAEGDVRGVANALDAYCEENGLPFGLGFGRVPIIAKILLDRQVAAQMANVGAPWFNLLNVHSGLGAGTLRCLPRLQEVFRSGSLMNLVNVEEDKHLSDIGKLLLDYASSECKGIKNLALNPPAGTPFADVMATLKTPPFQVGRFDLVLLGGSVETHQNAVETMLIERRLNSGAVIYSEVPPRGDEETEKYVTYLESINGTAVYEVIEITKPEIGSTAVLQNIKAKPHLNGSRCTLESWDEPTGRYGVRVDGAADCVSVLPGNLILPTPAKSAIKVTVLKVKQCWET